MIEYSCTPDTDEGRLPFSAYTSVGDLVFVSGQASVNHSGSVIQDSFKNEMRRSIRNLIQVLEAAGCELRDVVQTRNYVRDSDDLPEFNVIYREFFKMPYPARTTITGCLPAYLRYEIECVALVPRPGAVGVEQE